MNNWKLQEYTSAEDVPFGFTCYEMQIHLSYPPEIYTVYSDEETDTYDESEEDEDLPDYLSGYFRIIVIGYVIARSKSEAIDFVVKHFDSDSKESLLKNYFFDGENMSGELVAEDDEDCFELHNNEDNYL